jgi:hypothetical protein
MAKGAILTGLLLAASPAAMAQELPAGEVNGLVAKSAGAGRDVSAVSVHALEIDARLTDLLVALSQRFRLTYDIPDRADPVSVLRGLCRDCSADEVLRAGYRELERRMVRLRSYLDGDTAFDAGAVQTLVNETVVLAWALKGFALLEAVGYRDGVQRTGGGVQGPQGTIPDLGDASSLMGGTGEAIRAHFERMLDRRRQAEAAGLNYPNAELDTWLTCFLNCP